MLPKMRARTPSYLEVPGESRTYSIILTGVSFPLGRERPRAPTDLAPTPSTLWLPPSLTAVPLAPCASPAHPYRSIPYLSVSRWSPGPFCVAVRMNRSAGPVGQTTPVNSLTVTQKKTKIENLFFFSLALAKATRALVRRRPTQKIRNRPRRTARLTEAL